LATSFSELSSSVGVPDTGFAQQINPYQPDAGVGSVRARAASGFFIAAHKLSISLSIQPRLKRTLDYENEYSEARSI
jgi:hypothetical protein